MQKAPIVGVAGAAKYDVHAADASQWPQRSPLNQTYHGCVSHPFGDQSIPSVYGGAGLVQVLDGLLLAIDMEHPQASALRFDERFKFHFYDLDLCLQASTAGIPMYAMLMAISHDSHGSYHSPEWTETLSRYYSKWRAPAGNTLIGTLQMSG
jgi:GT2 family glycosyltransferase